MRQSTETGEGEEMEVLHLHPLAVLQLQEGDLLVLMHPGRMRTEQVTRLELKLAEYVPKVRCVVLEDGATLGVLRPPVSDV